MLLLAHDVCKSLSFNAIVNLLLLLLQLVHLLVIQLFMKRFKRVPQSFQAVRRLDLRMDLLLNVPYLAIYGLKVIGNRLLYCLLKYAGLQLVDFV